MPDVAVLFLRWTFTRAALARGWWLVTSVYLVVVADLSPIELVAVGVLQSVTVLVAEVPAGVLADTVSRRTSLVIAHVVMGTGMALTGTVTGFWALAGTQCLWGLGWAFSSGADIAWLTDELDRPDLIDRVLTRRARRELVGSAAGLVGVGALAWATDLATAIVLAGSTMVLLGVVVARFPEHRFTPTREHRWKASAVIFRRGLDLARRDREILVVFAATLLINGGAQGFGRLTNKRLVTLGFPHEPDPIVWFTALGLVCLAAGAVALQVVEAHIDGVGVARRAYVLACAVGVAGALVLAHAPDAGFASVGVILTAGIAFPIARTVGDIWVNRRTTSDVRATVHSFLSQAENLGEIVFGIALGIVAQAASVTVSLMGSVILLACAGALVATTPRSRARATERA